MKELTVSGVRNSDGLPVEVWLCWRGDHVPLFPQNVTRKPDHGYTTFVRIVSAFPVPPPNVNWRPDKTAGEVDKMEWSLRVENQPVVRYQDYHQLSSAVGGEKEARAAAIFFAEEALGSVDCAVPRGSLEPFLETST